MNMKQINTWLCECNNTLFFQAGFSLFFYSFCSFLHVSHKDKRIKIYFHIFLSKRLFVLLFCSLIFSNGFLKWWSLSLQERKLNLFIFTKKLDAAFTPLHNSVSSFVNARLLFVWFVSTPPIGHNKSTTIDSVPIHKHTHTHTLRNRPTINPTLNEKKIMLIIQLHKNTHTYFQNSR